MNHRSVTINLTKNFSKWHPLHTSHEISSPYLSQPDHCPMSTSDILYLIPRKVPNLQVVSIIRQPNAAKFPLFFLIAPGVSLRALPAPGRPSSGPSAPSLALTPGGLTPELARAVDTWLDPGNKTDVNIRVKYVCYCTVYIQSYIL